MIYHHISENHRMKASQVPGHFDIIIRKYFIKVTFAGTLRFIISWGPIGTCCSSVLHVYTYIMLMEKISMFVVATPFFKMYICTLFIG